MRALVFAALAGLSLCSGPAPENDTGLPGYSPDLVETERAACLARGGQFARGGIAGQYVCFITPKDAGQACSASTDCEGLCLARSRSCAPVKPLFGCNEVLTRSGQVSTLCVD